MIELNNVSLQFADGTWGLKNVTLKIPEGSFCLVCGANGSGKSSLFRIIAGIYKPTEGTIKIKGKLLHSEMTDTRGVVGLVLQDPDCQILGETVEEDVKLGPLYMGLNKEEIVNRTEEVLNDCGLNHLRQKRCYLLSGGEKKRLSIASVLAMHPEIVLLDEPFANLDFPSTRAILIQMLKMKERGHTIVVASHDVDMLTPFITHIAVLKNGRLCVFSDTPEEIIPMLASFDVRPPREMLTKRKSLLWLTN